MYSLTPIAKQLRFTTPSDITLLAGEQAVAKKLYAAKNLFQQARGLMCRTLRPGEALLFFMRREQRFSLHMWFVFRPIDVLFCNVTDKGLFVVEKKERFKPFTLYTARKPSELFIELPAGATSSIAAGDNIEFSRKIFKR